MSMPRVRLMSFTQLSSTVRLRKPRKSILSIPTFSRMPISHCVVTVVGRSPAVVVVLLADDALHRHVVGDRPVGDDDAGGVRADVAVRPLQLERDIDHLRGSAGPARTRGGSPATPHRVLEARRDRPLHRHELAHAVDAIERDVEHAADVLESPPSPPACRRCRSARPIRAPYFCFTYSMTSSRRSWQKSMSISGASVRFGSRKPLEEQVVFERADVAEVEHVADDRPAAGAAGGAGDAVLAGEADEVPHDRGSNSRSPSCR